MHPTIENILEKSTKQKIAMLLGLEVLMLAIFYFSFLSPVVTEFAELRNLIDGTEGLRVQIATQEGIAENLDTFRTEVAKLDVELKKALQQLPNEKEIDDLLAQVSTLAREAGLEIRLFKPQAEKKKDYYAEVPVELALTGTYHQLATFFDEVGHLDRIVNLDTFSLSQPRIGEEEVLLKSSLIATTFRFLREDERPKPNTDGKGARHRRSKSKEKELKI